MNALSSLTILILIPFSSSFSSSFSSHLVTYHSDVRKGPNPDRAACQAPSNPKS